MWQVLGIQIELTSEQKALLNQGVMVWVEYSPETAMSLADVDQVLIIPLDGGYYEVESHNHGSTMFHPLGDEVAALMQLIQAV